MGSLLMTRRQVLLGSAAAAGGLLLAACAPTPTTEAVEEAVKETGVDEQTVVEQEVPAEAADRIVIEFWWGWGGMTSQEALEGTTEAFNGQQSDVYVLSTVTQPSMDEKLLPAVAAGNPPDVAAGNIAYSEYCARGSLTPLDEYFEASQVVTKGDSDIISSLWTDASWQGKVYGLATCEVGPRIGLCLNLDLVEEAGLDATNPPLTWDEMYDWHEAMTKLDDAGNVEILGVDPLDAMGGRRPTSDVSFYWDDAFGFEYWDGETLTYNWDNEGYVASLNTIKKFYDLVGVEKIEGYRSSYGTWTQSPTASFPAGVQAMVLNGYWTPGELVHSAPERRFAFTWAPNSPERRGRKFQNVGGHPATIPLGAQHPAEGFKLIEFLTLPDAMDIILKTTGWLGPRLSWLETVDPSDYPGLEFFLQSVTEADELKPCPLDPICNYVGQQISMTWDAVNYGEKAPEEAAAEMQATCTEELRRQFPELFA